MTQIQLKITYTHHAFHSGKLSFWPLNRFRVDSDSVGYYHVIMQVHWGHFSLLFTYSSCPLTVIHTTHSSDSLFDISHVTRGKYCTVSIFPTFGTHFFSTTSFKKTSLEKKIHISTYISTYPYFVFFSPCLLFVFYMKSNYLRVPSEM